MASIPQTTPLSSVIIVFQLLPNVTC